MDRVYAFMRRYSILCLLGANLIWSTAAVLIKSVPWSSFSINVVRNFIAIFVMAAARGTFRVKLTKTTVWGGILMSVVVLLSSLSNKLTSAANAVAIEHVNPAFVLLYLGIFYKKRPKLHEILVVPAVLIGVILCTMSSGLGKGNIVGDTCALLCGAAVAGTNMVYHTKDANPLDITYFSFILGALQFPVMFFDKTLATPLAGGGVFSLIFLGLFQMGAAYVLFSVGIKGVKPLLASLTNCIQPVLSPLWTLVFLSEVPGLYTIIGGVRFVAAVVIYDIYDIKVKKRAAAAETA